jgi:hypothetical protein
MPGDIDADKVDHAVLALLSLGQHEGFRAWLDAGQKEIQCGNNSVSMQGGVGDR